MRGKVKASEFFEEETLDEPTSPLDSLGTQLGHSQMTSKELTEKPDESPLEGHPLRPGVDMGLQHLYHVLDSYNFRDLTFCLHADEGRQRRQPPYHDHNLHETLRRL
jgi:hypothetical protein